MATIHDLIEITGIAADTTYSTVAGNLLGVIDNASSTALDDGEFDIGDNILIGGVSYRIDRIQEPSSSGRFTQGDGTNLSFDPRSESNLDAVFLTVSNGGVVRYFVIPNDRYGDMAILEIRTGGLTDVAGSDAAIISTTNDDVRIVCFASGTRIGTPGGDTVIEEIRVGDLVDTRGHGAQAVRAVIVQALDFRTAPDRFKPIRFAPGALGPGLPDTPLCVSPQHRMLVMDESGSPVLVPAKALTHLEGVRVMNGKRRVTYHHLVFSRHEIIRANGAWAESLLLAPMAIRAIESLQAGCRGDLQAIFGRDPASPVPRAERDAAPILRVQEARRRALTGWPTERRHRHPHDSRN